MSTLVGKQAPDFCVEAVDGQQFTQLMLDDYKGKWLVVFFYPLDFTFVCPTEILAFSDRLGEFKKLDTELLGVSVDSKFSHLAWKNLPRSEGGIEGLAYPLASDMTKKMAVDYGVLCDEGVALRGLFVIDPDGVVQSATINNLPIGRSVDETLRVVNAAQFAREHGEVCPADWKPGDEGMQADPEGSRKWFAAQNG